MMMSEDVGESNGMLMQIDYMYIIYGYIVTCNWYISCTCTEIRDQTSAANEIRGIILENLSNIMQIVPIIRPFLCRLTNPVSADYTA